MLRGSAGREAAGLATLLLLPHVALALWLLGARGVRSLCAFLAALTLVTLGIALLARNWRRFYLLQFPFWLLSLGFTAFTVTYDGPPGDFLSYVLATVSLDEIRGFLGVSVGLRWELLALLPVALYLALALRAPRAPVFATLPTRLRQGVLGASLALLAFAAFSPRELVDGLATHPVLGTVMFVAGPLQHARAAVDGTAIHKVPYGATRSGGEEVHILIIGESARRDSWSVYGYPRPTTPTLDRLKDEAVFFRRAFSDANITIYAVPILLTGMRPDHFDMGRIRGNLVDLANEAGYRTTWMMNQDPHVSLLSGVHAQQMLFPPPLHTLYDGHLPRDERLLPQLHAALAESGRPRFIGMHVIGSHWEYASRYPASMERFGSGAGLSALPLAAAEADPRLVDAYDNSVLYTDWFIARVLDEVKTLTVPVTITFVADHGEDLLPLDGIAGHGTAEYSRHQFEVPAFVWANAAYRQAHPERIAVMRAHADQEIRSHNFFDSLGELMGIRWPEAVPAESFVSPAFVPDTTTPHLAASKLVRRPE